MRGAVVYLEDMSGDDGDADFLDRHVADEEADPLAHAADQRAPGARRRDQDACPSASST